MPDLLLELFSEEIPARMQRAAADNLKAAVTGALHEAGLMYDSAAAFVTPRRLTLTVTGIPVRSPDLVEEKKGPRVGAPQQALDGFLRGAGLASIDEASIESDPKKGEFYVARVQKPGAPALELLSGILSRTIEGFPWPKSMRWGNGRLTWVRPLRAITATFGPETEEPEIVRFSADGLESGQTTFGHRFLNPDPIKVRRFDDYAASLERAHVVLDRERRKDIIRADAAQLAFAQGLSVIEDEGLVDEVAGLVEWPVVMMGSFEESFLALPEEVIVTTIRANQKCFCLRDSTGGLASEVDAGSRQANPTTKKPGKLANRFVLTSNMLPADGGKTIVGGNERVIRARLSDAKFFYETDLKTKLEEGLETLKSSVFHAKLGSQFERIERLEKLASEIAPRVGADPAKARRAARLAKADLVTGMVGEFPELQGLMGRYYASAQGEPAEIATAIEMHYKPLGPTDQVPTEPVSIAVALADKLDLLTGFWSIDEKPTGSRDPFALRRAALGVIRILVENKIGYKLGVDADLLSFFHDRLKVMLRDQGTRHDLVDAVITPQSDDMLDIAQKAAALSAMLDTDTGKALLAGYRRAANILAAEEKKDGRTYTDPVHGDELVRHEEINLASAISDTHDKAQSCVSKGDYEGAIAALSGLQGPVDAFFEAVLVNDEDAKVRANRLNMLSELRRTMHLVADFSKVVG